MIDKDYWQQYAASLRDFLKKNYPRQEGRVIIESNKASICVTEKSALDSYRSARIMSGKALLHYCSLQGLCIEFRVGFVNNCHYCEAFIY